MNTLCFGFRLVQAAVRLGLSTRRLAAGVLVGLVSLTWSPAAASASEDLILDGRVLDEDDRPVAGAEVALYRTPGYFASVRGALEEDPASGTAGERVARSVTDRRGMYRLQVDDPGLYRVHVTAEGLAAQLVYLEPALRSSTLDAVTLPRSRPIRIRVTGPDGPVQGALVAVEGTRRRPTDWSTRMHLDRTDGRGVVELVWPVAEPGKVAVSADGYVNAHRVADAGSAGDVVVRLEPGVVEMLRFLDEEGKPLPGQLALLGEGRLPVGVSDAEGRIRVRLPPESENADGMALRVLSDDGRYLRTEIRAPAPPEDGPKPVLDVEVPSPEPVEGRVVDSESGEPVEGALVWAFGREPFATRTGTDGRFQLEALPGVRILKAGALGYQPGSGAHQEGVATLTLQPARGLVGRVVDRGGEGIEGAEIVAAPEVHRVRSSIELMQLLDSTGRTFSGEEGRFRLSGLQAGASYQVSAQHPGYAESTRRVTLGEDEKETQSVVLVLDPGRTGVGRVVDSTERPVPGAAVSLVVPTLELPRIRIEGLEEVDTVARAVTDADGVFRLPDLGTGTFRLDVEAAGFAPLSIPGIEIGPYDPRSHDVAEVPEVDLGVAVLVTGAEIRGRVVDGEGEPVANVAIFTAPQGGGPWGEADYGALPDASTGVDGRFVADDLEPGIPRRVLARAAGYIDSELEGVIPQTLEGTDDAAESEDELVVVIHGPSSISGRVVGPGGVPISEARILPALVQEAGPSSSFRTLGGAHTGEDGLFTLLNLPPGKIQLVVEAEGYRRSPGLLVQVPPGREVRGVEVQLDPGGVVVGRVMDVAGTPIPGAEVQRVQATPVRPGRGFVAWAEADGSFRLEHLPLGTVELEAHHREYGRAKESVEVVQGRPSFVEFRLGAGASISGQVVTPTGEPVPGAAVGLRPPKGSSGGSRGFDVRTARSGADGRFEMRSVEPGEWRLVAEHPEHGVASHPVEIGEADLPGVFLQLEPTAAVVGEIRGLGFEELARAEVFAVSPGEGLRRGEVRHDGTYRVSRLSPGSWSVIAEAAGRQASAPVEIVSGGEPVQVDLEFSGGLTLTGTVRLDGAGLDGADLIAVGPGDTSHGAKTDSEGRFRVAGLEEGVHRIHVTHLKSGVQHSLDVVLPRDEPLPIDLRAGSIFGIASAGDGLPLGGVKVILEKESVGAGQGPESASFLRPTETDAQGRFRFDGLPAGSWRVRGEKSGFVPAQQSVMLEEGADLGPVTLVLARDLGEAVDP